MGTALVYHEDMTATRLLWDDPECEIERPERLTATLDRLRQRGLEQRCLRLSAREASKEELGLVHSPEYVSLVRKTQVLGEEELQALSGQFDAIYFHPSTFHCARLAAGAGLQLVDAVLTGAVRNGLALVRPPGHHSQRAAANGFCVFNNVAIAAAHAKQKHGLHRCVPGWLQGCGPRRHSKGRHRWILIVDWDVHHGQGIQYLFEDDPSVLYFSWHRYEHGRFWPFLRESDADAVGRGQGLGFTVNLPWNQVGMGNADYVAAFLHLLLPLAFEFDPELVLVSAGFDSAIGDPEGQMQATPECFAHLTHLLQVLASGRVCAMLEGGYHLESLAESVCMTVQTLLGDPAPPLSGPMVPCQSALESIQSARAAQAPYWKSLQLQGQCGQVLGCRIPPQAPCSGYDSELSLDVTPVLTSPSTHSPEGRPPPLLPGGPMCKAAAPAPAPSSLLDQPCLCPAPSVRTTVALTAPDITLVLPPDVIQQEGSALREETEAWARPHESLARKEALTALGKLLYLLDGMLDGQVNSGIAATPASAAAATLDVAIQRGLSHGAQRLLCVALGQLDRPPDLAHDGRTLWLNIGGKEAAALSMFQVSTPLPVMTGGFLSCILGLVLPLAYGFQPDLVLVALGPGHGLQGPHAALLAAMLRGLAGGRVLALLEEDSTPQLAGILARVLRGEAPPSLGPSSVASPEDVQALMYLRGQLEPQWAMLQVRLIAEAWLCPGARLCRRGRWGGQGRASEC
ncbi:polyamine deacetylase HDAC10 isoform X1 [Chlorocebus sabaeus]|uniref:polyamine deacetylase HDAC10 isoform X1 n=1 Tax=Chlorocebus sabaeus TaxID=60711 RepID=UPI003BF94B00